jgi:hypothetical protein
MPMKHSSADEEDWSFSHNAAETTLSLSTSGSQEIGGTCSINVYVVHATWEVWLDNYGNSEVRNYSSAPLSYAGVSWSVETGDASLWYSSTSTDSLGVSSNSVTMGEATSNIQVEANGTAVGMDLVPQESWSSYEETDYQVSLTGPSSLESGATGEFQAYVERRTRTVWVSNLGNYSYSDYASSSAEGTTVYWSVETGDASLSSGSTTVASNGYTSVTVTGGGNDSNLLAQVVNDGQTSGDMRTIIVEYWQHDHSEAIVSLQLSSGLANSYQMSGDVFADVLYESWEIWTSNLGGSEMRNQSSVPADGAQVQWWISSGSATVDGSTTAGSDGRATASFSAYDLGSHVVAAQVSYGAADAAYADMTISVEQEPEEWTLSSVDRQPNSISFEVDQSTSGLIPGDQRVITATVRGTEHATYTSNWGNTSTSDTYDCPMSDVTVHFVVDVGDGTISHAQATTDGGGIASTTFTMGTIDSQVSAEAGSSSGIVGSVWFSVEPEVWNPNGTGSEYVIQLYSDEPLEECLEGETRLISAEVLQRTFDVYVSNWGNV